jgi:heme-degrading monooxygenase HmoA
MAFRAIAPSELEWITRPHEPGESARHVASTPRSSIPLFERLPHGYPSEEETVIIRVFRPTIHPGKESEFESFLRETAVPLVSQQSGLVAQHVGRPHDRSSTEYVYVTVWEDVESIQAFAGERWQEAVIEPDEEHLLKDTWIGHYEAVQLPDSE